ncbi:MAG: undecaprenyldiphospho-muramoylpentapeptide beta-N-acetylglucosaminyltransferase [Bacteroidetes bacterium]|nr:undecaprenyldiphospho-muramoylpentapeptide beta-N-acetylglucosaminyltransferase [Bacteroidota bacterium]MDA1121087.1 undecaprenyldiphospho-muramoylpentapeptide beta-N-acetylglucosaminyltransferase [Bacteroidota bacterium]
MTDQRIYRVIICGGGTGGHIYPAIAIANTLREKCNVKILFVGALGKMEMQKVPEAGFEIIGLWISGLQRRITLDNLSFPFKVVRSVIKSLKIIRDFQPDVVVGVGGYASGPLMFAATSKKIPALIQEQNSYAGLTNKWLAKRVQKICVAYSGMEKFFPTDKIVLTGNPVRKDILDVDNKKSEAVAHFSLKSDKKTVLIIGGSLGARSINEAVVNSLPEITSNGFQVIWQTGKFYNVEMIERTKEYDLSSVRIVEFLKEMDLAYAASSIVISRAGALSISELCIAKRPVIFIPSPNVAEDHQTKNAMALVNENAALMIPDKEVNRRLAQEVIKLAENNNLMETLAVNIGKLGKSDASNHITDEIIKLMAA